MVLQTTALQAQFFATTTTKKLPLETVSRSFGCSFTRFSGLTVLSSVSTTQELLRFPQGEGWPRSYAFARSHAEGLGDFSLFNNETTSWLGSGSLAELSTTAGSLLLLVVGPLSIESDAAARSAPSGSGRLHLTSPHYSRKTARLFPNYAYALHIPEIMPA